jgi:hypothetical protein
MEPIFDVRGETVGWLNRGKVYSTAGRPRALIRSGAVFSFATVHLGWFGDGFFRDRDGAAVAWIRRVTGGPATPPPGLATPCPYLQFAMPPTMVSLTPPRPLPEPRWSDLAWDDFLGPDALLMPSSQGAPPTMADLAPLIAEAERERQERAALEAASPPQGGRDRDDEDTAGGEGVSPAHRAPDSMPAEFEGLPCD